MKTVCTLCVALLLSLQGCLYSGSGYGSMKHGPQQVFQQPDVNRYQGASVGIIEFSSPDNARGIGRLAAELLYQKLLSFNVYSRIELFPQSRLASPGEGYLDLARSEQLDLLIIGEVDFFLEGGNFQASQVCEAVQAVEAIGTRVETVWQARSCEQAEYTESKDLIFYRTQGKASASARELLQELAGQFAAMFLTVPAFP